MADRLSARQKREVAERANGKCEYCFSQVIFSPDPFSTEHVIPKSLGGKSELSNLAFSCQGCNNRKYTHTEAIDPLSGETAPLYHPRLHQWKEHFRWNEDCSMIIGISPTGRATVDLLKLNRKGVVNLRKVLTSIGKHPPE